MNGAQEEYNGELKFAFEFGKTLTNFIAESTQPHFVVPIKVTFDKESTVPVLVKIWDEFLEVSFTCIPIFHTKLMELIFSPFCGSELFVKLTRTGEQPESFARELIKIFGFG